MRNARLIINPIAGTKGKEDIESLVKETLENCGWDVDVHLTHAAGDAGRLAEEAALQGYYAVIGVGGDGTVNEIASALCGSETVLGIIPCGSGNGLARHLGIPMNAKGAVDVILKKLPIDIDYALVNGKKFFCTCGIGFDAQVSDLFAQKPRRGLLTYLMSVIETYPGYTQQKYLLHVNGRKISVSALLIAICNASQYGNNVYIAPRASIKDGLLDVTVIHSGNLLELIQLGVDLLTHRIDKNLLSHTFRCESLKITREEKGLMHIDGDPLEAGPELSLKCIPKGLKVFASVEV